MSRESERLFAAINAILDAEGDDATAAAVKFAEATAQNVVEYFESTISDNEDLVMVLMPCRV